MDYIVEIKVNGGWRHVTEKPDKAAAHAMAKRLVEQWWYCEDARVLEVPASIAFPLDDVAPRNV